jgi:hypothetical protein
VLEQGVFLLAGEHDRHHGHRRQIRDDRGQLLRDALGVGEVCDDETRHVRERHDGLGEVAAGGLVEVEQHRHVAACAQFVAQRIEQRLALRGETAQQEHRFAPHRVDHAADLLVVQKQVNELCHLQVVHGDGGLLARGADDQIGLILGRPLEVPGRDAIDLAARQRSAVQAHFGQRGMAQDGARQVGVIQLGSAQAGGPQVGAVEVGAGQIGEAERSLPQVCAREVGARKVDSAQIEVDQQRAAQVRHELGVSPPPCVPGGDTLLQTRQVSGVGHDTDERGTNAAWPVGVTDSALLMGRGPSGARAELGCLQFQQRDSRGVYQSRPVGY